MKGKEYEILIPPVFQTSHQAGARMNAPEFSLVIPVYNEKDNLPELIDRCLAACKKTRRSFEIILVNDGSRDGSRDIISRAAERYPEVVAVILNRNYGQHAAVFAGLGQSKGEIVVTLDADLQNPPEEIPRLVREMDRGVDVVGTVRKTQKFDDELSERRVSLSL